MTDDIGVENTTAAADPTRRRSAGRGFYEQWQRALERVHLGRQATLMRSVPAAVAEPSQAPATTPERGVDSAAPLPSVRTSFAAKLPATAAGERGGKVGGSEIARQKTFHSAVKAGLAEAGVGIGKTAEVGATQRPVLPAVPRPVPAVLVKVLFPAASAVTVTRAEQGLQVFLRDATLQRDDVLRLLNRLHGALAGVGERLLSVSLNGEPVWQRTD
ncbi:hypothetical protein FKG94_17070 [Exilibacterium tricleocarpae]|uniref:Uncharacterized protein n=1 Tax=Exilibacterium tricleocarpae TaxID=2591008 RepID=A0A545T8A8_9GAMM|nr:hypothetical protein [Exilibacterium tricleocarpae]TQV73415.1 hypothetical protein FKG94_17070 [Exilibacterium tricleocarpae]